MEADTSCQMSGCCGGGLRSEVFHTELFKQFLHKCSRLPIQNGLHKVGGGGLKTWLSYPSIKLNMSFTGMFLKLKSCSFNIKGKCINGDE